MGSQTHLCIREVPTDGVILRERGGIDEAKIIGESMPVSKEAGQQVFEAMVNLDGILEVAVARTIGDSTITRMFRLVRGRAALYCRRPPARSTRLRRFLWGRARLGAGALSRCDAAGRSQPLRVHHIGARGDPIGTLGGRAGRRVVQGRRSA